ncbi:hypothetical protein [Pseudoduganella rivuli]|nr:hypothetical protein [Pseudoduganella rivuli]
MPSWPPNDGWQGARIGTLGVLSLVGGAGAAHGAAGVSAHR